MLDAHLVATSHDMGQAYNLALVDAFVAAVEAAGTEVGKVLRDITRVMASGVGDAQLAKAHETIARKGQDSVLRSYDQVVTARNKRRLGPYRDVIDPPSRPQNVRFANGKLRAALGAADFWEADAHGIRFINVDMLNHRARQWARLSAGAGGRGAGSKQRFEVKWGELVVASLGLNMRPSPSFVVPKGYWFDPESGHPVGPGARGTSRFFPMGEGPRSGARSSLVGKNADGKKVRVPMQRRRVSRGIEARNFLDAGVRRIAREIGPTYERVHREWFETKVAHARPASQTFHVTVRKNLASVGVR
jgi:hypothetical protein